jgi:hypothetical protein
LHAAPGKLVSQQMLISLLPLLIGADMNANGVGQDGRGWAIPQISVLRRRALRKSITMTVTTTIMTWAAVSPYWKLRMLS